MTAYLHKGDLPAGVLADGAVAVDEERQQAGVHRVGSADALADDVRRFLRGLGIVLPIALTIYLVVWAAQAAEALLKPLALLRSEALRLSNPSAEFT